MSRCTSSRESFCMTLAAASVPMLNSKIAAFSRLSMSISTAFWFRLTLFIATHPCSDHFSYPSGVLLNQQLQMLKLYFQFGTRLWQCLQIQGGELGFHLIICTDQTII